MIKLYFKQAWQLLKQNPLFSSVYVLGTGLGIAMTMSLVIIYYIKMAPVYPEENRNRILVSKGMTVDAEVVEEKEGSYELIGNLSVYMLAPSVGSKDKVAGEVRDAFRKYNFSQKKYRVDLYGQPVSYWKSTFYEYCNSAPDWGKLIRTYGTILLALLFVPALNLAGMIASRMKRQLSEMGIRKAFGASKASLLMQVFWENLFLTGLGGLLGLLLSYLIVYPTC